MAHNSLESVIKLDLSNTLPSRALQEFNGHEYVHISVLHKRSFSHSCAIINHFIVFSCKEGLWHWKLMCITLLSAEAVSQSKEAQSKTQDEYGIKITQTTQES